jgi:hypothetical protein
MSDDILCVDVFRDVGHKAKSLGHERTLCYLREVRWYPGLTDRRNWESWEVAGAMMCGNCLRRRYSASWLSTPRIHHRGTGARDRPIGGLGQERVLATVFRHWTEEEIWVGWRAKSLS